MKYSFPTKNTQIFCLSMSVDDIFLFQQNETDREILIFLFNNVLVLFETLFFRYFLQQLEIDAYRLRVKLQ